MIQTNVNDAMGNVQRSIKRSLDITFSFVGLVVAGTVFFKQERIGYKGRPFTIYKFRTMSSVVEENGPQLIANCNKIGSTKFERFLRNHHLDELPQLWNVLRGDMSFVGPRPERKYFIDQIMQHTDRYPIIYKMRPGVTSQATLYNGYTDTMEKMLNRLEMDIYYLEHRTLWLDAKIVAKTFISIVSGKKF